MGAGFIIALLMLGSIREVLGSGSFLGLSIIGHHYEPWIVMILPPGGFLTLGCILLGIGYAKERRTEREKAAALVAEGGLAQ